MDKYFLNYGGEFLDAKETSHRRPGTIEATKSYDRSNKSAPAGVAGFNWMESLAAFAQGRAAMWIDGVGWAPGVKIRIRRASSGKVGYAMVPAGPKGQYSATYGDGIGIGGRLHQEGKPRISSASGGFQDSRTRLVQAGGGVPFRNSILTIRTCRRCDAAEEWFQSVLDVGQDQQSSACRSSFRSPNSRSRRRGGHRDALGAILRPAEKAPSSSVRSWSAARRRRKAFRSSPRKRGPRGKVWIPASRE